MSFHRIREQCVYLDRRTEGVSDPVLRHCIQFAVQTVDEQARVGDDSGRLCGTAVDQLADHRRVDIDADRLAGGRNHVAGADRVEHRADH